MISQLNWNRKIIEIQIIISIVRVSEHFSKMLVLSGVFNTGIWDATNYANQDYYACQLLTYSCLHYALSNRQPIKKRLMFCLDMANSNIAIRKCSSRDFQWMVMSVGDNLKIFGQFLCPAFGDRSHHQSLIKVLTLLGLRSVYFCHQNQKIKKIMKILDAIETLQHY
jgi:hypothetical protein